MNASNDDANEEIQLHRILDAAALTLLFEFPLNQAGDKSRLLQTEVSAYLNQVNKHGVILGLIT